MDTNAEKLQDLKSNKKVKKTNIYREKTKCFDMPTVWMHAYIFIFFPIWLCLLLVYNICFDILYFDYIRIGFFALNIIAYIFLRVLSKIGYYINIPLSIYPAAAVIAYNIIIVPGWGDTLATALMWALACVLIAYACFNIRYFYKRKALFFEDVCENCQEEQPE